jgi:tRNA threonylcarbamoyladenosine biosynthesis protein TsaE
MRELFFLYNLDAIDEAAARIIEQAGSIRIWLFTGDMGAGKTTLIKAISQALGATGDFSSPTYSLVNEYTIAHSLKKIYHLDLYRLRSMQEALDIGIGDYLFNGDHCFIEWPGLILPLLKEGEGMTINITSISEIERKVTIFM